MSCENCPEKIVSGIITKWKHLGTMSDSAMRLKTRQSSAYKFHTVFRTWAHCMDYEQSYNTTSQSQASHTLQPALLSIWY